MVRTKPLRDKLKDGIQKGYDTFWGGGNVDPNLLTVAAPLAAAQGSPTFSRRSSPRPTHRRPPRLAQHTPAWSNNRDC